RSVTAPSQGLRAYGEMVGVLWSVGKCDAAVRLEQYWSKILTLYNCALFCAYPIDILSRDLEGPHLDAILDHHSGMISNTENKAIERALFRALDERLGTKAADARTACKVYVKGSGSRNDSSARIVGWLRENLSGEAEQILARAEYHYVAAD